METEYLSDLIALPLLAASAIGLYQPFIFKGMEAPVGPTNFMVSINRRSIINHTFRANCGGAIVARNWVVTAAHCVSFIKNGTRRAIPPQDVAIGYGSNKQKEQKLIPSELVCVHKSFIPFEETNLSREEQRMQYDLALIRISGTFPNDYMIESPLLSSQIKDLPDSSLSNLVTLGWGVTTSVGFNRSDSLKYSNVVLAKNDFCSSFFGIKLTSSMRCVHSLDDSSPCVGDSGGALISRFQLANPTLIGVLSMTRQQCGGISVSPAVFTRISEFRDWAVHTIEGNSDLCLPSEPQNGP